MSGREALCVLVLFIVCPAALSAAHWLTIDVPVQYDSAARLVTFVAPYDLVGQAARWCTEQRVVHSGCAQNLAAQALYLCAQHGTGVKHAPHVPCRADDFHMPALPPHSSWATDLSMDALTRQHRGGRAPHSSCGTGGVWDSKRIDVELRAVLARLSAAVIQEEPFPHLVVDGLFSPCFWEDLMNELPPKTAFVQQKYPGTESSQVVIDFDDDAIKARQGAMFRVPEDCRPFLPSADGGMATPGLLLDGDDDQGLNASSPSPTATAAWPCFHNRLRTHSANSNSGWALTMQRMIRTPSLYPLWLQVFRLAHSANFTTLLVHRFSGGGDGEEEALPPHQSRAGIPAWKQIHIAGDVASMSLKNTAALRIEPVHYHLSPHVDVWEKLVTWQLFYPPSDVLQERGVGTLFFAPKPEYTGQFQVNDRLGVPWLDYRMFDVVKEIKVSPNRFYAFAPNNRSWHGAAIEPEKMEGVDSSARRTLLGFVTRRDDSFHHFDQDDTFGGVPFFL